MPLTRRQVLIEMAGAAAVSAFTPSGRVWAADTHPRAQAIRRFRDARFGLFVHYGMASLLPGGKLLPRPEHITESDLEKRFTAEKFDANAIADLAVAAGMRYVNFTPFHGGGPYMWRSAVAHPNTVEDLPSRRDLLGEMAEACSKRGLDLFLYVHWTIALSRKDIFERNQAIFNEWLTRYGRIAGLWFDTDSAYYKDTTGLLYPRLTDTFAQIRKLQPECLISYCHGVTGDEDYLTYEHRYRAQSEFPFVPAEVRKRLADKPVEICTTMQLQKKGGVGTKMWFDVEGAYHRTPDEIWQVLGEVRQHQANLLLNIGPRANGSVHPADERTLREVGRRLKLQGFPVSEEKPGARQEGEDR